MLSCTSRSFPLFSLICLYHSLRCHNSSRHKLTCCSAGVLASDRKRFCHLDLVTDADFKDECVPKHDETLPTFALTTTSRSRTASTHSFLPPLDITHSFLPPLDTTHSFLPPLDTSTVLCATQPTAVMLLSIPLSSDSSTNAQSAGDSLLLGPCDLRSPCDCFVNDRSH